MLRLSLGWRDDRVRINVKKGNEINKLAMVVVLVAGVMAGGMAQAQSTLKTKQQKECEENGCNNRPEVPKTRSLKPKPQKEACEENSCNNRPEVPKTRSLKPKPQKEACEENGCNNRPELPKTRGLKKKGGKEECEGYCN